MPDLQPFDSFQNELHPYKSKNIYLIKKYLLSKFATF